MSSSSLFFVEKFSTWLSPILLFFFILLSFGGLFGNSLVIGAVIGNKKMCKSAMNLMLINLALADLFNLALTSLEWAPTLWIGRPHWPINWRWGCPLIRYFECVFLFASILSQLIVCIERFIAICYPLQARRLCSNKKAIYSLIIIWIFVLLFSLPNILFNRRINLFINLSENNNNEHLTICINPWSSRRSWIIYKWAEFILFFFTPAICCVLLYSQLFLTLKNPTTGSFSSLSKEVFLLDKNTYKRIYARRRVVRLLIGCVAVQLLCYSPIQAIFLAKSLFNLTFFIPYGLVLLLNALTLACSAANPLLYTLCSSNFRDRIKEMILKETKQDLHPTSFKIAVANRKYIKNNEENERRFLEEKENVLNNC
ncbi:unnamed protein product [Meloidogyne enterolobii]|uniref:Uncharacterized protein n=1 Tax=Meloidogyne enterolobii TaxID=390850 RepID=A0ACB0Y2W0_MELEN